MVLRDRLKLLIASLIPASITLIIGGFYAHIGSDVAVELVLAAILIGFLLILVSQYKLTYQPLLRYKEEQLTNFLNEHLSMIESELEEQSNEDLDIRANVMMLSSGFREEPNLSIEYVADKDDYRDEELNLKYDVGQGCAGKVIEANNPRVARSSPEANSWRASWGTTPAQDQATGHLCTIIGVPIYRPKDTTQSNPIGVFAIDSGNPIDEMFEEPEDTTWENYDFGRADLVIRAADHAKNIGILV